MARHLILHIGTTKTGSTSIQHALHAAREHLPKQGVYYPETDNDVRHLLMAAAFSSSPTMLKDVRSQIWQGRDPNQVLDEYLVRFKAEMAGLPPEITRVVLSAEQFSRYIRTVENIQRMHDMLAPYFDEMKVVVYLRRQDAHFASTYAQSLRTGRIDQPDLTKIKPWYHDYDYADLVGRWAAVFGEAAMCPLIFEKTAGKKFDVVAEFLEICGVTVPPESEEAIRERNLSMNRTGQHILTEIGATLRRQKKDGDLGSGAIWLRISRSVSRTLPGAGWLPTQAEAAAFMAQFAETNEQVRKRWFPERQSLFSTDFSKLPEVAPVVDYEVEFKAACSVILEVANDAMRRQQQMVKMKSTHASKAKDTDKHRQSLLRAVKLDGSDIKSRLALARLQIEDSAFKAATHNLTVVLKQKPDHPIAHKLLKRLERLTVRQTRLAAKAKAAEGGETKKKPAPAALLN